MLEPAAMGLPVIFGPHVFNFATIAQRLQELGAAQVVNDGAQLAECLLGLMADASQRHDRGQAGKRFVEVNRGALSCLVALVERELEGARGG
jgi:3-deoxy-D-manno-octulosonic-acid transferase